MEVESVDLPRLTEALGENTRTVIPFHFLERKRARAWADEDYANVIVQTDAVGGMAFMFGDDVEWQAEVLAPLGRLRLYWCPTGTVRRLLKVVASKYEADWILEPDIQRTVAKHVELPAPEGADIRRLTSEDLPAIRACAPELEWLSDGWGSWERIIERAILIGAMAEGRMVSGAVTFARSAHLDDIGVATEAAYQGRGLSSACASMLVREMLAAGRTPVWTVFRSNTPSVRISDKLGFVTQTECTVIREKVEEANT